MDARNVVKKIGNGDLHYALGRFYGARRAYSRLRRLRSPHEALGRSAIWPDIDPVTNAIKLENLSYVDGFDLPQRMIDSIRDYAASAAWFRPGHPGRFKLDEVDGASVHGRPIAVAYSDGAADCADVREIASDPALLRTVALHLGYRPTLTLARLYWSPVSTLDTAQRRALNQTIEFHYDVDAMGFCYAHFYLNDVALDGGPHVLVPGSHRRKPLRFLLGSARASEEAVISTWGDSLVTLTGPAGTGFLEDTSCFHRAMPPEGEARLMLQLRFN